MAEQHIDELAALYAECMKKVVENLPVDTLGEDIPLTSEDYRTISTTIFMEHQKQIRDENKSNSRGSYNKSYQPRNDYPKRENTNPATEAQQKYIASLIPQKGKEGEARVAQFLDDNGLESAEQLTGSQASVLISTLKEMPNDFKKPGFKKK